MVLLGGTCLGTGGISRTSGLSVHLHAACPQQHPMKKLLLQPWLQLAILGLSSRLDLGHTRWLWVGEGHPWRLGVRLVVSPKKGSRGWAHIHSWLRSSPLRLGSRDAASVLGKNGTEGGPGQQRCSAATLACPRDDKCG